MVTNEFRAQARWFERPDAEQKSKLLKLDGFGELGESTALVHKHAIGEAIGKAGNKRKVCKNLRWPSFACAENGVCKSNTAPGVEF